jgi:hypothetical protein
MSCSLRAALASLALVTFLSGCAPFALAVAPAFPDGDRAEIRQAAEWWNARTVASRRLTVDQGASLLVVVEGRSWQVLFESPPDFNGWTDQATRTVRIRPVHEGVSTYAIALHEMGHVIGLGHTSTGVMDPTHVSVEFTDEVQVECRRVGACP